jgi:phospholipid/cholesterol/gamma-HCH transport system permease protein
MLVLNVLHNIGQYTGLMGRVFIRPDNWRMSLIQLPKEIEKFVLNSLVLVIIVSAFIGAIMAIQIKLNTRGTPLMPHYATGFTTRDAILLEFSATIMCIILAGKVGSNIASEIGTMRITEQIDALEIMGVNSANYLILPKIVAFVVMMPLLVIVSMALGVFGGYLVCILSDIISPSEYIYGLQYNFHPFYIFYSIIKSLFFAFIISSVSSYYGYYVKGGALDVGKASTKAVVNSSILILLANIALTNLMLT